MNPTSLERLARVVVWSVWSVMTVCLLGLAVHHSTTMPWMDELGLTPLLAKPGSVGWSDLWQPQNEHRMPLAKLLYLLLAGGLSEPRAPILLSCLLLSATAASSIIAARVVRGRTSLTDVLFPFVWLQWTQVENLLSGFQLAFVLPAVLAGCALAWMFASGGSLERLGVTRFGIVLALLPWCAAPGFLYASAIVPWSWRASLRARRAAAASERRRGTALLAVTLGTCALLALYFAGFEHVPEQNITLSADRILSTIGALLARGLGWHSVLWSDSKWLLSYSALMLATLFFAVRGAWREDLQRERFLALAALIAGVVAIGAALGSARTTDDVNASIGSRYATLALPAITSFAFAWIALTPRWVGRLLATLATLLFAALVPANFATTHHQADGRLLASTAFLDDLRAGMNDADLAHKHWRSFYPDEDGFRALLSARHSASLPPYDRPLNTGPWPNTEVGAQRLFFMFASQPSAFESEGELTPRRAQGEWVLVAPPVTALHFSWPGETRRLEGTFGLLPSAVKDPRCDGARFKIELRAADGTRTSLFERVVDPRTGVRGPQPLSVELPAGARGELVLITDNEPGRQNTADWCYWGAIALR